MESPSESHHRDATAKAVAAGDGVAAASVMRGSDAPLSNRASDSCSEKRFQVLSRHVDSLELSYQGTLKRDVERLLGERKAFAQSREDSHQALGQIEIATDVFQVRDKGAGYFPYVLENGSFFLKVAQRTSGQGLPFAYCQVRSEYLVQVGPRQAENELRKLLGSIADISHEAKVSRIDLEVDFATDHDMESWSRDSWVTHIQSISNHYVGTKFSGWQIGSHKNPVSLRLYDKTLEIEKQSGKRFLHDIWKLNGWVPWDSVWRVEGEFRREGLGRFGLTTLDDVLPCLGSLWGYLTEDVVRLTIPSQRNEQRSRWPLHPLWAAITAVPWDEASRKLERVVRPNGAPTNRYFARTLESLVTSYMARENVLGIEKVMRELTDILYDHLTAEEKWTCLSPSEALAIGAKAKGRRYHTLCNVSGDTRAPPLPDWAVEHAYRRASRGS